MLAPFYVRLVTVWLSWSRKTQEKLISKSVVFCWPLKQGAVIIAGMCEYHSEQRFWVIIYSFLDMLMCDCLSQTVRRLAG